MNLFFPDETSLIPIIRLLICIFAGLVLGYLEFTKKFQLSYSKFNVKGNIDTKKGMLIIYSIPLILYTYLYFTSNFKSTIYHQMMFFFISFHFGKRCFETLFVHIYSGKISILTTFMITYAYSSIAYTIHQSVNLATSFELASQVSIYLVYFSCIIFFVGQFSNLYHHIILRKLRLSNTSNQYLIPNSGLFQWINCPHYLSEIIAWIGICILSQYTVVYGLSFIMSSYLIARSLNTTEWYKLKIENFPTNRKSILPFIL